MKEMTALQAASYAEVPLFCGPPDNRAVSVERDSRKTGEGSIFVALPGTKNDGNDFAFAAYDNGCRIFLLSSESAARSLGDAHGDASVLLAEDGIAAMQRMAKNYLAELDFIRIAVTGSVGKTSTKEMIFRILSSKYRTVCNEANFNNHIGVPLTAFRIGEDTEAGIFEMGMNHAGEIRVLADIVRPQIAVITNVGTSHIGNLGSRENIMKAKMEAADFMDSSSVLIYNADNDKLSSLSEYDSLYRKIAVGTDAEVGAGEEEACGQSRQPFQSRAQNGEMAESGAKREETKFSVAKRAGKEFYVPSEVKISDITASGEGGIEFRLHTGGEQCRFSVPLPGVHNAYNAALAAVCGAVCGILPPQAAEALASMESSAERLHIERHGGLLIIDDTYNASPDSVRAAIDVLRERSAPRRVAILADMYELGENSREYHLDTGRYAAESGIDLLIAIGPKAKGIAEGAAEKMERGRIYHFSGAQQFLESAGSLIEEGDAVLVKGSHGMSMNRVVKYLAEAAETGEWNGH